MLPTAAPLDLPQLCDAAEVTPRTVRYYIQQGLLPAPESRGPGAHYNEGHLARLRLIKRLQNEHLPLGEIRQRLEKLTDPQIHELLQSVPNKRDSAALSYIRSVLTGEPKPPLYAAMHRVSEAHPILPEPSAPQATRSNWERMTLTADVELHVRRPLTREKNRFVERLLELASKLSMEENK